MYRAVSPCGSWCSFSSSWSHVLSQISVLCGSVDASVEGLSRQWMDQTLRPHLPLRVPMNLTSTTFGIRCCHCSATHMIASSWEHCWMRWIWAESRSLVMSLWMCCATKRRFIVLKEISFGTVTLGESFRRLVGLHLPAQTLHGTRVRGEPALDKWRSRTRSAAGSFKYTSSGTPLPSKWPYRFGNHCHNRTCVTRVYLLGIRRGSWTSSLLVVPEPSRTFNVDCPLPSFLQLPTYLFHTVMFHRVSLWVSVPSCAAVPWLAAWHSGSTCQDMLTEAYTWSCQRILACYRFSHLGTIDGRQCAIAPCRRFKIGSSFQLGQSHPRVSTRRTLLLSCLTFWSRTS